MSTTRAYFQPKKKYNLTAIGYWHSIFEPEFPDPAWFVDEHWHTTEKQMVIRHLSQAHPLIDWTGKSWCRFRCGNVEMGSADLTDGAYIFPQGLVHYLEAHLVKLPEEFIRHVQEYKPTDIPVGLEHGQITYDWWLSQQGYNQNQKSFTAPNDELITSYTRLNQHKDKL